MFESLIGAFKNQVKSSPITHMATETIVDGNLIAADGSMGRMVRLGGLRTMKSLSNFAEFSDILARGLASGLNASGHAIQFHFVRNPKFAEVWADDLVKPMRLSAEYFDLDLNTVIESRREILASRIIPQAAHVVFWTRPSAVDPEIVKAIDLDVLRPKAWPSAERAQDIFSYVEKISSTHNSWANDLIETMSRSGISLQEMTDQEVVSAMRASIDPSKMSMSAPVWTPSSETIPGAKTLRTTADAPVFSNDYNDLGGELWPALDDVVFEGADARILSGDRVRLGNHVWASYEMARGPLDQEPFSKLVSRVVQGDEIPWSVSIMMETEVLPKLSLKRQLAKFTGLSSDHSRMLRQALDAGDNQAREGRSPLGVQMIFSTWASVAEEREKPGTIDIRAGRLQRAVEGWGGCLVSSGGDPLLMTVGGALGLSPVSPAARGVVPHRNAIYFLPLSMTTSPLATGSVTFLTETSTPYPWEIGNSLQNSVADFAVGMPGQGKSNLASSLILSYLLSESARSRMVDRRLPFLGVVDIGDSQIGMVNTFRAALPPHRIEEAQYHRLLNSPEYATNPFDTQPGFRKPTPPERQALVNFLTTLITPAGRSSPPDRLAELCGAVIDHAYRMVSDEPGDLGTPKLYTRGFDREVDALIEYHNLTPQEGRTSWWDIVDGFHYLNTPQTTEAAILAQRNAVPILEDLGKSVNDNSIETMWGNARFGSERLIDMFRLAISSTMADYPILSRPTQFRLGSGRFVVLDLGSIAGAEGPAGDKTTAVMYMMARSILTRGYYVTPEIVQYAPPEWAEYHRNRIQLYREAPKRIIFDEYHKTRRSHGVREQLITDIREGRKWGVQIMVLSQLISDFDEAALNLATSVYVLGVGNDEDASILRKRYNLSPAAAQSLSERLTGPTSKGAPFLILNVLKTGRYENFLYNLKSPLELWVDNTSPDNKTVRDRLAQHLGYIDACKVLAKRFPGGSVKAEMDRILRSDPTARVVEKIVSSFLADTSA